ncbi:MAG: tetratricopeptide repeat protein, partial [Moraxellaceae bacterium]|nr:tetratricopeptide repeat protein [Moraxellaceae bacterium]
RQAIALDAKEAYPWVCLGSLLKNHLGRYAEAEEAYRQAIALDAKEAYPWVCLGNLLQDHLGCYAEAEEAYRQAILLDASNAIPWNGLGNLLQDHLGRYAEAISAYQKAIEIDPQYNYAIANLARLYAFLNHHEQAIVSFREAVKKADIDAEPELILQANLYLCNQDTAMQALVTIAEKASQGSKYDFNLLKEQAFECQRIGIGHPLAQLMEKSHYADFLQPFSIALQVVNGQTSLLDGVAPELQALINDIVELLKNATKPART